MKGKKKLSISGFKCKRGMTHESFFNIFDILMVATVIVAILLFINDVVQQTIFEKNYMARDMSILINTLYAAPGEVVYNYNENVQGFIFDIADNNVNVYRKQDKDTLNVFYPFAKNNNIPIQDKTLSYEKERVKIKFHKSAEFISVDKPD